MSDAIFDYVDLQILPFGQLSYRPCNFLSTLVAIKDIKIHKCHTFIDCVVNTVVSIHEWLHRPQCAKSRRCVVLYVCHICGGQAGRDIMISLFNWFCRMKLCHWLHPLNFHCVTSSKCRRTTHIYHDIWSGKIYEIVAYFPFLLNGAPTIWHRLNM